MTMVVEPVEHRHTQVLPARVVLVEFVEHIDLQLGGILILRHILDDLERHNSILVDVVALDNLAEGALAQHLHHPVPVLYEVPIVENEVVVVVVLDNRWRGRRLRR